MFVVGAVVPGQALGCPTLRKPFVCWVSKAPIAFLL